MINLFAKKDERRGKLDADEMAAIQASVMGRRDEAARIVRREKDAVMVIHTFLNSDPNLMDVVVKGYEPRQVALNRNNMVYAIFRSGTGASADKFLAEMPKEIPVECFSVDKIYDRLDALGGGYSMRQHKVIESGKPQKKALTSTHKLVTYKLNRKKSVDRVKFVYALKGRGNSKGMIEELGGSAVGKGCMIMPVGKMSELKKFFDSWDVSHSEIDISLGSS